MRLLAIVLALVFLLAGSVQAQTPLADAVNAVGPETFQDQPLLGFVESTPVRICVKTGIGLHIGTQMFDLSTTMYGIGTGHFREANPALKWAGDNPLKMALAKSVIAVGSSFALIKLSKNHPKSACVAAMAMSGITGYAGARNYRNIRAWQRSQKDK